MGYLSIKMKLLPRSTLEGLGAYTAVIGLPSLLFESISRLRFARRTLLHPSLACAEAAYCTTCARRAAASMRSTGP